MRVWLEKNLIGQNVKYNTINEVSRSHTIQKHNNDTFFILLVPKSKI